MLELGTKIIVIGSGVTRKAGPRIGSIGYILNIENFGEDLAEHNEYIKFFASVLFTRYGFQKKERQEIKRVCLFVPNFFCQDSKEIPFKVPKIYNNLPVVELAPLASSLEEHKFMQLAINLCVKTKTNTNLCKVAFDIRDNVFVKPEVFKNKLAASTIIALRDLLYSKTNIAIINKLKSLYNTDRKSYEELLNLTIELNILSGKKIECKQIHEIQMVYLNNLFNGLPLYFELKYFSYVKKVMPFYNAFKYSLLEKAIKLNK